MCTLISLIIAIVDILIYIFLLPLLVIPMGGLLALIPGAILILVLLSSLIVFNFSLLKILHDKVNIKSSTIGIIYCVFSFFLLCALQNGLFGLLNRMPQAMSLALGLVFSIDFLIVTIISLVYMIIYIKDAIKNGLIPSPLTIAVLAVRDTGVLIHAIFGVAASEIAHNSVISNNNCQSNSIDKEISKLENENRRYNREIANRNKNWEKAQRGFNDSFITREGFENANRSAINNININNNKIKKLKSKR